MHENHDEAWYSLIVAHARATAAIDARLRAHPQLLPLEDYDVLLWLKRAPGPVPRLRLSELAKAVTLSRSGLTRLVDRLEKAGFLRREACPTDRRGAFAVLTARGAQALKRTWPVYATAIEEVFASRMTEKEAAILAEVLGRVIAGLNGDKVAVQRRKA